jgi:hypothetical protein
MPDVFAGFDRVRLATPGQRLITAGLYNCVGIAGWNPTTGNRILAHYNTNQCTAGLGRLDQTELTTFVRWLSLRHLAWNENCRFEVVFGFSWKDSIAGFSREAFFFHLDACFSYNTRPVYVGLGKVCIVSDQAAVASDNEPATWNAHDHDGVPIPYRNYQLQ